MKNEADTQEQPHTGWRFKLGTALLGLSVILPLAGIPLVTALNLSAGVTTSVSAVLLVSAEVMGVVSIAVMGKSGFALIKNRVFGFLKQYGPPDTVSRGRYTVGLVMFVIPILFGWISVYTVDYIPYLQENPIPFAIGGDLLFLTSIFVLGGDFWDKVRSLFIYNAKVDIS
jgi:hypothetical protein